MTDRSESRSLQQWASDWLTGWDAFWFTPSLPHSLALMRIACGSMLVYVHVIWAVLAADFFGPTAWVNQETIHELHTQDWGWSWLFYVDSVPLVLAHQTVAIIASLMMACGLLTRLAIPLAWWMTLMVCHRMTGALFGLDQIVVMLSMYLMFARSGSVCSLDAWLARTRSLPQRWFPASTAATSNTVAVRLIQLHLCVIYVFGGLSKMRGEMWFEGSALWWTAVNYEYQSLDITWLGNFPWLIAALTAGTIFWETFYCALVWPRQTRPLVLMMAVFVHAGIGLALGMVTFGAIMIIANAAFLYPETVRNWMRRLGVGE